ncbi:MAG: hypothetical protein KDE53_17370 [Caldilineaceae bacterium]|nr:hypothetical protein [Caldilineaceae bacterium]MCB0122667.1 hypothetical protein [Caldilineaceae bacterium]
MATTTETRELLRIRHDCKCAYCGISETDVGGLLSDREIGDVPLLTVEMSEGEAEVLLGALDYFLAHVAQSDIESLTGAYPDEVKGMK